MKTKDLINKMQNRLDNLDKKYNKNISIDLIIKTSCNDDYHLFNEDEKDDYLESLETISLNNQ